jgi:hypothetical protein
MKYSTENDSGKMLDKVFNPSLGRGLYLFVRNEHFIDLGYDTVQAHAEAFWNDPTQLDESIKDKAAFMPCSVCSNVGKKVLCLAIRPLLPLSKVLDQFVSYDETVAFYKDANGNCSMAKTSLQNALNFVVQMGLIDFCDVGQQYKHWFLGTHPLMTTPELVKRVYLNLFWIEKGNMEKINQEIKTFADKLRITISCQMIRIRLVAKSDPILNALVSFNMVTLLLQSKVEENLQKELRARH